MTSTRAQTARDTKEHARNAAKAAEFFVGLAKAGQLPVTSEDFRERVEEFFAKLDERQGVANALVLGAIKDEPCPVSLFKPWASYDQIRLWSKRDDADRLETEVLNGKLCVKPSAFFTALKKLGRAA